MYRLLSLCARATCGPAHYHQLAQQASEITEWTGASAQAEAHGLGPLLYSHLQAAGVRLPPTIRRELQGLYLRHRHANRVRACVLAEILTAYQAAGIQALVLKGAAIAHLVYPEPGLRPMRDVDLLVRKSEVREAQRLLGDLGFQAPLPDHNTLPSKHLEAATRSTEGLSISVEVHHNLFHDDFPVSMEVGDLTTAPCPFDLDGVTAYTLGYEDLLWHLCQHIVNIAQLFRLIWVSDIVSLAQRFGAEIDWGRVERQYPRVLNTLALFHYTTPLSDSLQRQVLLKIGRKPQGIGVDFQGWPRASIGSQRAVGKGYGRILGDTLYPSDWWLRLYYGLGTARPLFWCRWVTHPLRVFGWVKQLLLERMGWRILK